MKKIQLIAGLGVLALALSACNTSATANDQSDGELSIGVLPGGIDVVLETGIDEGFFEDEGLELNITRLDSGPSIINGVVAGEFEAGWAGTPPILQAVDGGADIVAVAGATRAVDEGQQGVVVTDPEITTYKDLEGKVVGTNAPRSVVSLAVLESIRKDGGDPTAVELVPIPLAQSVSAIQDGQVDAAVVVQSRMKPALAADDQLVYIGDPNVEAFGLGSVNDMFFTSGDAVDSGKEDLQSFRKGLLKTYDFINSMSDDEWLKTFGEGLELPEDQWDDQTKFDLLMDVDQEHLESFNEALLAHEWISEEIETDEFTSFIND